MRWPTCGCSTSSTGPDDLALKMTRSDQDAVGDWRLKLYVTGGAVTLSRALPVLQTLGADVLDERPFEVRQSDGTVARIYDFGLTFPQVHVVEGGRQPGTAEPVLRGVHRRLVRPQRGRRVQPAGARRRPELARGRGAAVLRALPAADRNPLHPAVCRAGAGAHPRLSPISPGCSRCSSTRTCSRATPIERAIEADRIVAGITAALDAVTSLDADRILRTMLSVITATSRTNEYRLDDGRQPPGLPVRQA